VPLPFGRAKLPTLKQQGISNQESHTYRQLARVQLFERELADLSRRPSWNQIIHAANPRRRKVGRAQGVWRMLRGLQRDLDTDPREVYSRMSPRMRDQVRDLAPRIARWLTLLASPPKKKANGESVTAAFCGDPEPGRSALDHDRGTGASQHWRGWPRPQPSMPRVDLPET
jgi:hypothetical protein